MPWPGSWPRVKCQLTIETLIWAMSIEYGQDAELRLVSMNAGYVN